MGLDLAVTAVGGFLLIICTGIFVYLFFCYSKNSETKDEKLIKCPCGSENIVMLKCAECQQPTTGCLECCCRLSSCVCDEDTRAKPVARPRKHENNLTSIVQEHRGGCSSRLDKLDSNTVSVRSAVNRSCNPKIAMERKLPRKLCKEEQKPFKT